ncbi:U3 snoRNP protein [Pichia californica]|nr:U3 snoRNP protein [[Candida] californica]
MVKKVQKTASSRRWAYKSFRDHVDSIKIDPLKDITTKAFHNVEISHFLSTLEHWREVNLSKNFQDLVEIVEPISMTLPQLIYHKDKIFQILDKTLSLNDILSLQPTLELLSQFVHDLGPDFMDYYIRTLEIIKNIALNQQDPQSLELIFNSLAYIFKYLSKILIQDLNPTFISLLPLLIVKNKDYITRFTSEALSFLIRKSKISNLQSFLNNIFNSDNLLIDNSDNYHLGLSIMFTESFKSASGVLHSKTSLILPILTKTCLKNPKFTSILSDIIMDLLNYTNSKENSILLYNTLLDTIKKDLKLNQNLINYQYLTSIVQILLTLSFAESGKKINDWNSILIFIDLLYDASIKIENYDENNDNDDSLLDFQNSMASWCSIIIRNSDMITLSKYHVNIIKVMTKLNDGSIFLPFIDISLEMNKDRTIQFTKNSITSFITHHWQNNYKEIAYFLERINNKELINSNSGFNIIISSDFKSFILESFKNIQSIENKNALINNYWRLLILKHCTIIFDPSLLIKFLSLLLKSNQLITDFFILDVFGATIGALINQKLSDDQILNILKLSNNNFNELIKSTLFLSNFEKFISSISINSIKSLNFLNENKFNSLSSLSNILKSNSHENRETTLNLIISIFNKLNDEIPDSILMCRTIEQIPLNLQHARDVPLRFRQLAQDYSSDSILINNIIINFLFGQLSNKFSPSWQGVQEFLIKNINKVSDLVWKLSIEFISMNYNELHEKPYLIYDFDNFNIKSDISNWLPQDSRLFTILNNFEINTFHKYENINYSIIEFSELKNKSILQTDFLRYQVIKLLNKIPSIAESNFIDLLPFLLNDDSDDISDVQNGSLLSGWTMADRNGLIELMTHFNKLKKVPSADKIHNLLLILLMDRQTEIQKLALDCLLNFKNPIYNKYQNHLKNLLDDTLFRDEIVIFLQNGENNKIESNDIPILLPLVLRILFGRAQTLKTNSTKVGRKVAAIKSLNNLNDIYVTQFLQLTYYKFDLSLFKNSNIIKKSEISKKLLKHINGFINMNLEVTETLGRNHRQCLSVLVEPLIYALSVAETSILNSESFDDNSIEKAARNARKSGFKLFYQLIQYLGDDYNWKQYSNIIYKNLIESKMDKFGEENLSGASSLMKIMTKLWCTPERLFFLCMDDFKPIKALMSILPNPNAKDNVLILILQMILSLLNLPSKTDDIIELLTIVISECLDSLVLIFDHSSNSEVNSLTVQVLLSFISNDYVTDNDNRKILINSLTKALEKPSTQIDINVKVDIVRMISLLVEDFECSYNEILPIYTNISKLYSSCKQSEMRNVISTVFYGVSNRFNELEKICQLIIDLNAYDSKRFREPDYDRRLQAFSEINEKEYNKLNTIEWIPILYTCMFFIDDENDQSLRSSASYTFNRYIDGLAEKSESDAIEYITQLKELIIPTIKSGVKRKNELVRSEYIRVLDHIVGHVKYYNEFDDMKILLKYDEEDEESDFFEDIIHLQVYKRQRSIRALSKLSSKIKSDNIAHYILPIIEHYAFWTEEKYRNVANDTIPCVKSLTQYVTWHQFKAILTRYITIMKTGQIKEQTEKMRDSILLIVSMSAAMREWTNQPETRPSDYPKIEKIDLFVVSDVIPKLQKILSVRNEDTVIYRVPLSEALISLIMCCSQGKIDSELAGLLTNVCQILRARSENLRDSVRKHLGRISISLGPHYLKFIIKELKGALTRGPQIHILSFTIHHLITIMSPYLEHGSLGDSVSMIMECIMNDIFGEASEEKEATGYSNKTKEIKHNKSFDTGELIAANIFLKDFNHLLTPVKYLLNERLNFKSQSKLEQLMRRFSQGLNKNEESSSTDILVLCNEIFNQASEIVESKKRQAPKAVDEKTERFLVQLDKRAQKTQVEYSLYVTTLQQFSFDLLKTAISKNDNLFKAAYLAPFVPILQNSLSSEDEGVVISSLKVLTMLVRLEFVPEVDSKFTEAAGDVLKILQDMPSTNNEICQNCLKFLSNVIRFKDDLELKDSAISYILKKIEPDLDSPERQHTAFGFLKAIMFKNIMIPEIYDCMDVVSKLMVTSTTSEIRQVARSVFYTFLMEYDQSRGRLEKQFKLIINNLKYPAQAGRLSVMDLILTIVRKSSKDLLSRLTTTFFISLANVSVTDDNPSCRESATEILGLMFKRLDESDMDMGFIEKYTSAWLSQNKKNLLVRCALNVYKIYINSIGFDRSKVLDDLTFDRIGRTLKAAKRSNDDDDDDDDDDDEEDNSALEAEWQMVYSCLSVLESLSDKTNIFAKNYSNIWEDIINSMLYPHSWIRLSSSRLIFKLLKNIVDDKSKDFEFKVDDATIQTIAYRTFRQLGAPNISEKLALQSTANLVYISKKWDMENTKYISFKKHEVNEESEDESEGRKGQTEFVNAFDWALNRCAAILKNDSRNIDDMIVTKRAIISYCEFLSTFLSEEKLKEALSERLLIPLLHISELEIAEGENQERALPTLATGCLEKLSKKIGISDYNILLSNAMKIIQQRRFERKTKRAQLSLSNPEIAARRKLKKHFKGREKRKSNKDENGLYKAKRRRM